MSAQSASRAGPFERPACTHQIVVLTPHQGCFTREMLPVRCGDAVFDGHPVVAINGVAP